MRLSSPRLKAVACFLLCSNVAAAGLIDPLLRLRADAATTTDKPAATTSQPAAETTASPTGTAKGGDDGTATDATTKVVTTTATGGDSKETTTTDSKTTSTSSSILPTATLTNSTSSLNETLFNSTIPDGQLPLQPVVTPAWGVGGIIMLLTGAIYGLVGIRNKMLHTFFSTAYLAGLGTTVLVIYVMSPPISNAVQGAYLVAAVCTGLILGGIAIVFKEIAEGFGCLLGGFSFGMWLLCLRQGGLIQSSSGTIIFIVAFTVGAYAFYFSHYTRHYALMACIAFGGATATVIGIDAFSRAGLKEFWAYIWNLNSNLFPLGADTYPITKGIRVELAVIILLFFAGLVSQLKLWRLVQERRAKRDAARLEDEQKLAKEEENVGRQIEASNARDRQAWEATYGDGTYVPPPPGSSADQPGSGDSGVGDMDSEKQMARSQTTASISRQSRRGVNPNGEGEPQDEVDSIEMADMQPSPPVPQQPKAAAEVVMEQDEKDGAVMVRVAQDEYPEGLPPQEHASRRSSRRVSAQNVGGAVSSNSPGIVPLPFRVPEAGAEGNNDEINEKERDDRSSVATFADEDEEAAAAAVPRRASRTPTTLAKRLSQGSVDLLRSISQRSKRAGAVLDKNSPELGGQSQEELVSPRSSRMAFREDDDNSSLAVTMDGMSSDEDEDDRGTIRDGETKTNEKAKEIEVKPELSNGIQNDDADAASLKPPRKVIADSKHMSAATVSTDILGVTSSTSAGETKTETEETETSDTTELPPKSPTVPVAKSTISVDSTPAALTKDRLPRSLSRVAMSYRTNEWAKHLSNAEQPEYETLQLGEPQLPPTSPTVSTHTNTKCASAQEETPVASPVVGDGEAPAPLNVAELQQTAETGAPAPLAPRSASAMSSYGMLSRSNSHQSLGGQDSTGAGARGSYMSTASTAAAGGNSIGNGYRSISANQLTTRGLGLHNEPIAEENDAATEAGGAAEGAEDMTPNIVSSPFSSRVSMQPVPGVVSFNAPQTLIGQREMLLRSKSQQGMYIGGPIVNSASMASLTTAGNTGSMTMLPGAGVVPSSGASDGGSGSMYNFYPGAGPVGMTPNVDLDDLPMNQRRELMRNSSLMSLSRPESVNAGFYGNNSGLPMSMSTPAIVNSGVPTPMAGSVPFDSHQPKRDQAHLPTAAARQAQLASFRSSVAADLRTGATVTKTNRESLTSPYLNSNNSYASPPTSYGREHEVQQNINMQRNFLMSQKEAEAQRREFERQEKERNDRAFEERMRRGDLLEAHRDAMRRMQASAGKK
ncbi:hypothetical protein Sste5346_002895 [Sporothrix stenoceras]|uniref:TM7S3/TM198-like domain-containing protein n=1 Tax=Sporothrix stenoceras TaxID=5173 RepID=A0ABR3ZFK8_9PEZI